jgi:hypothetical protein
MSGNDEKMTDALKKLLPLAVVVAGRGVPPGNGVEVILFVDRALTVLGAMDLTFGEFCQLMPESAEPPRLAQLRKMREEAAKAAEPEAKVEAVKQENLPAAVYAPPKPTDGVNTLNSRVATSSVPQYIDPITGQHEAAEYQRLRLITQHLLELVLAHHLHLIRACVSGDIAKMVGALRGLCCSTGEIPRLKILVEAFHLCSAPRTTWPQLSATLSRLNIAITTDVDDPMHVGPGVLAAIAKASLAKYPEFETEMTLMGKMQGETVTIPVIIHNVSLAYASKAGGAQGMMADFAPAHTSPGPADEATAPAAGPTASDVIQAFAAKSANICFNWRDKGICRYGDACRFPHIGLGKSGREPPPTDGCYECGGPHTFSACPKVKGRQSRQKENQAGLQAKLDRPARRAGYQLGLEAKVTRQTEELKALRAKMAKPEPTAQPQAATALVARLDPFDVYGPDCELATVFAPAMGE